MRLVYVISGYKPNKGVEINVLVVFTGEMVQGKPVHKPCISTTQLLEMDILSSSGGVCERIKRRERYIFNVYGRV